MYVFVLAYVLDWIVGDPEWLPHPVRWMGRVINVGNKLIGEPVRSKALTFSAGALLTVAVVFGFGAGSWLLLKWVSTFSVVASSVVAVCLAASTLASRSLLKEARAVRRHLVANDLEGARKQVARIVGRDTFDLNESEVRRATIETLAESASDGIVAPMFYLAIGGVPLALAYKAINTLDSMIGHRDERYEYFGKFAARLDDVANFLPARITALLLVLGSSLIRLNARQSWRILIRDGGKHKSPNAGRPEAAMAGALGVRLGGTNSYDGTEVRGQYLGDELQPLDDRSLSSSLRLTIVVSLLMFLVCVTMHVLLRLSR